MKERRRSFDGQRKSREKVYLDRIALRERLDAVGLTPEEASERMGYSPKYLERVLRGGKPVSERARKALRRVLGRDLSATDVRATLPEGPARRGFREQLFEDAYSGKVPFLRVRQDAALKHGRLPDFQPVTSFGAYARSYFAAGYRDLNAALRHRKPLDRSQKAMLIQLMARKRPLSLDAPLYRGIHLDETGHAYDIPADPSKSYAPKFHKGQDLTALEPLSTSTTMFHLPLFALTVPPEHRKEEQHRGSVAFEIHGAKGSPAIVSNEMEQEVLLAPGRTLRVLHSEPRVRIPSWYDYAGASTAHLVDEWVVAEVER